MSNPNQQVPELTVDIVYDEAAGEHKPHWFMNGADMGEMDWEMSADGKHGFVDYVSRQDLITEQHLGRIVLPVLAEGLHLLYPQLETVDFPKRQEVFKRVA